MAPSLAPSLDEDQEAVRPSPCAGERPPAPAEPRGSSGCGLIACPRARARVMIG
jgi:hypothetical protein